MNASRALFPLIFLWAVAPSLRAGGFDRDGSGNGRLGHSVAGIGDIDNDGHADFLVGEPDYAGTNGRAIVVSGRTSGNLVNYVGQSGWSAGWSVSSAGDIDNDGLNEILVGCPDRVNGGIVVVLDTNGSTIRTHTLIDHRLGASVSPLDDVNGDGHDDYLCGSDIDQFGLLPGRFVCYDGKTGNVLFSRLGAQTTGWFARALCKLGDIDGDGVREFAVGAPGYTYGIPFGIQDAGQVTVHSGANGNVIHTISGFTNLDSYLGCSVSSMADYDKDGVPDLIAGAYGYSNGGAGGAAFILSGLDGSILRTETGANPGDGFGHSVVGTGDVNRNGIMDFVVGSPFAGGGKVQLFSGSWGQIFASQGNGKLGFSVAAPGDVDGDGDDDILYGAPEYQNPSGPDGRATVYAICPMVNRRYGQGHPGTSGLPALSLDKAPYYGSALNLHLGNSRGQNTFALLLLGLGPLSVPTPKDGTLLVDFVYTQLFAVGPGGKDLAFTAPTYPGVCGPEIYYQSLVLDPGASKGLAFSRGLEVKFGFISSR